MILLLDFLKAFLDVVDLDPVFVAQPFQSLHISHLLMLHQEAYGVAFFVASEAVEILPGRRDVEARGLLLVERTTCDIIGALPFQRDKVSDYLDDVYSVPDPCYGRLVYHSDCQSLTPLRASLTLPSISSQSSGLSLSNCLTASLPCASLLSP